MALATLAGIAFACGGGGKTPTIGPVNVPSASGSAGGGPTTTPPPSGLPPMASMPPPGVAGSRKARKKSDGTLYACGAGVRPNTKDPAEQVKRIGDACAGPSRMHASGAAIRGQEGDRDAHQEHRFRTEANKCYRVYFSTDESVRDAVLVMRDSAGDIVAESAAAALPEDGALCFNTADEVTLLVSVGAGKGGYVAQVWSD